MEATGLEVWKHWYDEVKNIILMKIGKMVVDISFKWFGKKRKKLVLENRKLNGDIFISWLIIFLLGIIWDVLNVIYLINKNNL